MGKHAKGPLPRAAELLRQRIVAWRNGPRTPAMPEELWDAVVELAQDHGVCPIARAVGVDYATLRRKVAQAPAKAVHPVVKPAFLELPTRMMVAAQPTTAFPAEPDPIRPLDAGSVIDISTPDGARLRLRLEVGCAVDAAGIVSAFLGGGQRQLQRPLGSGR